MRHCCILVLVKLGQPNFVNKRQKAGIKALIVLTFYYCLNTDYKNSIQMSVLFDKLGKKKNIYGDDI